jgi:hypothetical protein
MGIMNEAFKPTLVQKHTQICLYKALSWPVLYYGTEAWTIHNGDSNRLVACEMKFMRRTARYMKWDHERSEDIVTELKIESVTDCIKHYQENWRSHVSGMYTGRFPKAILQY